MHAFLGGPSLEYSIEILQNKEAAGELNHMLNLMVPENNLAWKMMKSKLQE